MLPIRTLLVFFIICAATYSGIQARTIYSGPGDPVVIPLWAKGAPGFEDRVNEAEKAKDYWVRNIHNPSLTAYFPEPGKANGTSVVICPGGGHRLLVITAEGEEAAAYFTNLGVTAFVLKYRLFRDENSPYKEQHARQDGIRAMQIVRSKAKEFGLNAEKIGIMGFSAGGELAAWTAFADAPGDSLATDPVDRISAHPDFQILVYPGPLAVERPRTKNVPPAFMVAANDDKCCSGPLLDIAKIYREMGVPVEMHLYAQGDHAFNMGKRSELTSISSWPDRLRDWLFDNHWIASD